MARNGVLHIAWLFASASALAISSFAHGQCGSPDAAPDCCASALAFGCQDEQCCNSVCAVQPFCCTAAWSFVCAWLAVEHCDICPHPCGEGKGDCCVANGSAGCDDPSCCDIVCGVNSGCCMNNWTQTCANLAAQHCEQCIPPIVCGSPGTGDCCEANGSPHCNNAECCESVCAIDPYCCEVEWDECCVHLATQHCSGLTGCHIPDFSNGCGRGDCCSPNDSPGCDDGQCCSIVCPADPFCCDVQWDSLCSDAALWSCSVCWSHPKTPPLPPNFSCKNNCGGAAASGCWCDEACCSFGDCCEDKGLHCVGCQFGQTIEFKWTCDGVCGGFSDWGCVCDDWCVQNDDTWLCCSDICTSCPELNICTPPNPADLTGSGGVGVPDLLILLQGWGACQYERCFVMEPNACPADFNHDGAVGVADLLFLLQNWGAR